MTNRRGGLGRGLDALIPSIQPSVEQVDIDPLESVTAETSIATAV